MLAIDLKSMAEGRILLSSPQKTESILELL